MTKYRCKWYH